MRRPFPLITLLALVAASPAAPAAAETAATVFRQSCMSCHTIGGGRLVGPDLKDVTARKDRGWLAQFIVNPKSFLDGGDPYAMKLKEEARGAIMPPISGIDAAAANALLDLIEAESKLEKSQFAGLTIGDQPFAPADIERGHQLFIGSIALVNRGPSCISCHRAAGLTGLGGGLLGPDLTRVYERLQGRKNLAAWLQAPATPTMRPQFVNNPLTNDEIIALVAYLEDEAIRGTSGEQGSQLGFFLLGLGGAVVAFTGADRIWRRRFRAVRRPMVRGDR